MVLPHISVCVCTYRRPELLRKAIRDISRQWTGGSFVFSIVVADNDVAESAKHVVLASAADLPVSVTYCVEPRRNIALARNMAVRNASGEYIAFIDDDECPGDRWLLFLYETCVAHGVDGVLGPVIPDYEREPPTWVRRAGFYDRPRHSTGFVMGWRECRTGNVLLKRSMFTGVEPPFRLEFGAGGEDVDFFKRMAYAGKLFVWCDEAFVHESVPPNRLTRAFLLRRALLRGQTFVLHPELRLKGFVKALLAIPLYTLMLPFLFLFGHHWFMRYLVRLCDHTGKLLALLGIRLVRTREM
jgi:glycosyltransferase involved in cell wall biosynthesis